MQFFIVYLAALAILVVTVISVEVNQSSLVSTQLLEDGGFDNKSMRQARHWPLDHIIKKEKKRKVVVVLSQSHGSSEREDSHEFENRPSRPNYDSDEWDHDHYEHKNKKKKQPDHEKFQYIYVVRPPWEHPSHGHPPNHEVPECPDNEVYFKSNRAPNCEAHCSRCDESRNGAAGCYCRKGFVRKSGRCIEKTACRKSPTEDCDANEEPVTCGYECREKCGSSPSCTSEKNCSKRCQCQSGFVRLHGVCIPSRYCPLDCRPGEIESCIDPCSELCDPTTCTSPLQCKRQCVCPIGQKRLPNGVCVDKSQCPLQCRPDERIACIDGCSELCDSRTCTPSSPCKLQCACPIGQKRLPNGACVDECPLVCPPNERIACIDGCSELCDAGTCRPNRPCKLQCACPIGQKRLPNGACVDECPLVCPPNERIACIDGCSELCDAGTCRPNRPCKLQCACPIGQKRLPNGACVDECPLQCRPGERLACTDGCSDLCDTRTCTPSSPCKLQCTCPEGRKRLPNGICIDERICQLICRPGERLACTDGCSDLCDARTCTPSSPCKIQCTCPIGQKRLPNGACAAECPLMCRPDERIACIDGCSELCVPGTCTPNIPCKLQCACPEGQMRLPNGQCVDECPEVCPPDERMACTDGCSDLCDPTGCSPNEPCQLHCVCRIGQKKLPNGACVEECPTVCPPNERMACTDGCSDLCVPGTCTPDVPCKFQCTCPEGQMRAPNGECVDECPEVCPPDERLACTDGCSDFCDPTGCSPNEPCQLHCVCPIGQKKLPNGACVEECPTVCPPNERMACTDGCSDLCVPGTCTPDVPCKFHCICPEGQMRAPNGDCVTQCNCLEDEILSCIVPCTEQCDGFACADVDLGVTPCTTQCNCQEGFKRDSVTGECVRQCSCPPNAEYKCGKTICQDCQTTAVECNNAPATPCVTSCYCADNFRLVDGECKPFSECSCGGNAMYRPNGRRCQESCSATSCIGNPEVIGPGCYCTFPLFARVGGTCSNRLISCIAGG